MKNSLTRCTALTSLLFLIIIPAHANFLSENSPIIPSDTAFVEYAFVDINGHLKSVLQPCNAVESTPFTSITIDGSSIAGLTTISQSDLTVIPDPNTRIISPWSSPTERMIQVLGDIECALCPRGILKTMLKKAEDRGYLFLVGPELEFFILKDGQPIDTEQYCTSSSSLALRGFFHSVLQLMAAQEITVEKMHHEVARGQYEISIAYDMALAIADQLTRMKHTLTTIASHQKLSINFMPKPYSDCNGSGLHLNLSLCDRETLRNLFYDESAPHTLSSLGQHFIAGILKRLPEITLLLNPSINSYKRLVPGYEAPTNIGWGYKNRSVCIRIPQVNAPEQVRAEIRSPDPLCNPYLAFAALLAAGLAGIENQETLSEEITENLYKMSPEQRAKRNIRALPSCLSEALMLFEESPFIHETFGTEFVETYSALKRKEIEQFSRSVTDWELKHYGA